MASPRLLPGRISGLSKRLHAISVVERTNITNITVFRDQNAALVWTKPWTAGKKLFFQIYNVMIIDGAQVIRFTVSLVHNFTGIIYSFFSFFSFLNNTGSNYGEILKSSF